MMSLRGASVFLCLLLLCPAFVKADNASAAKPGQPVAAVKIWDRAPHNAFTDLIRFGGRWFCTFREGKDHVSTDGALRVITSTDGRQWESAALITSKNADLRDPKLTVTPDGRLMLCAAAWLHDQSKYQCQSLVWFSRDGRTWGDAHPIGDPDFWLWRVTWHKGRAYSIGYGCRKDQVIRLYVSQDGKKFDRLVERLFDKGYPNETSIVFVGDTAYCLLRRDGEGAGNSNAMLGIAQPPFTKWEWKDLGVRIGGPHMIRLPDGQFIAAVRLYDKKERTSLCRLDPVAGKLTEFLPLPSGGDTSYPGLVVYRDELWISYYSSHEGKTNIYL
ncbi:MAG: glycoside hydrolase, partial [Gemmataceae bacterium]|nr:glycoside hydrolase [Gemmataceae bacterium]